MPQGGNDGDNGAPSSTAAAKSNGAADTGKKNERLLNKSESSFQRAMEQADELVEELQLGEVTAEFSIDSDDEEGEANAVDDVPLLESSEHETAATTATGTNSINSTSDEAAAATEAAAAASAGAKEPVEFHPLHPAAVSAASASPLPSPSIQQQQQFARQQVSQQQQQQQHGSVAGGTGNLLSQSLSSFPIGVGGTAPGSLQDAWKGLQSSKLASNLAGFAHQAAQQAQTAAAQAQHVAAQALQHQHHYPEQQSYPYQQQQQSYPYQQQPQYGMQQPQQPYRMQQQQPQQPYSPASQQQRANGTATAATTAYPYATMDNEQKNAAVAERVQLLPGEKVTMFMAPLLYVEDKSANVSYHYNPNPAGALGGNNAPIWCCAMTYYRVVVFQQQQHEPVDAAAVADDKDKDEGDPLQRRKQRAVASTTPPPAGWSSRCWMPAPLVVLQMPLASTERAEKSAFATSIDNNTISNNSVSDSSTSTIVSAASPSSPSGMAMVPATSIATTTTTTTMMGLTLYGKDNGRQLRFVAPSHADTVRAYEALLTYAFPGRRNLGYLFAFESRRKEVLDSVAVDAETGRNRVACVPFRKRFDALAEFQQRLQISIAPGSGPWQVYTSINANYALCGSYPSTIVGPSSLSDSSPDAQRLIQQTAAFRSEGRLPALTWADVARGGGSIWRASQPKVGLQGNRSSADELFLKHIMESASAANMMAQQAPSPPSSSSSTSPALTLTRGQVMYFTGCTSNQVSNWLPDAQLKILDLRPRSSAMANRTGGYGYENTSYYPGSTLQFCNIGNIHAVRDAYQKLSALCTSTSASSSTDLQWNANVEDTKWLQSVRLILAASWETAWWVHVHRLPVLVHCSHGK